MPAKRRISTAFIFKFSGRIELQPGAVKSTGPKINRSRTDASMIIQFFNP